MKSRLRRGKGECEGWRERWREREEERTDKGEVGVGRKKEEKRREKRK